MQIGIQYSPCRPCCHCCDVSLSVILYSRIPTQLALWPFVSRCSLKFHTENQTNSVAHWSTLNIIFYLLVFLLYSGANHCLNSCKHEKCHEQNVTKDKYICINRIWRKYHHNFVEISVISCRGQKTTLYFR